MYLSHSCLSNCEPLLPVENMEAYADDDSHGSDRDAPADDDIDMMEATQNPAATSTHGSEMDEAGAEEEIDNPGKWRYMHFLTILNTCYSAYNTHSVI
jgi:hypothetical protein